MNSNQPSTYKKHIQNLMRENLQLKRDQQKIVERVRQSESLMQEMWELTNHKLETFHPRTTTNKSLQTSFVSH